MIRISILGAGKVARHLYAAFNNTMLAKVVQCYNRKGEKLHSNQKSSTITNDLNLLKEADVYILAISDDAIEEISKKLPFQKQFVVHTSGSVPISSIYHTNRRGVFYPLQTFSKDRKINFSNIPFCLEAENKTDLLLLNNLANTLSQKTYTLSSDQRSVLHVAAVFINNFTNYLFSIGNDICSENDIPFEILHPLIQETAKKIVEIGPDDAQTGPAVRNDKTTINRHLTLLNTDSGKKELYKILTEAIRSKYGKKL